ncbi:fas-binding factor 1 homolog isoform X2 [Caloenas nicobarica]
MEPGSSRWQPVVWETHGQREQMLRREKEQQVARLLWQRQDARQERAELLAQHQQCLSALEQQHQLEQLRELQSPEISLIIHTRLEDYRRVMHRGLASQGILDVDEPSAAMFLNRSY